MICGVTKKTIFKSERAAQQRIMEINEEESNRSSRPKYFNTYRCEFCGFFHLTGKKSRKEFDNAG